MFLMLSTDDQDEPRFQIGDGVDTQQIFGMDVEDATVGNPLFLMGASWVIPNQAFLRFPMALITSRPCFMNTKCSIVVTGIWCDYPWIVVRDRNGIGHQAITIQHQSKFVVERSENRPVELKLDQVIPPIEPPATPNTSSMYDQERTVK